MSFRRLTSLLTIVIAALASAMLAQAQIVSYETAALSGLNSNPPVISPGSGHFQIHLEADAAQFELTYENLGTVNQVHIHLSNPGTNGGVVAFICTNMGNAPTPATPMCPASGTPVTGTLTAAEIVAVMDGDRVLISAMDFEGFKQAVVGGATYVNVHTDAHPPGEVRGQINERVR
ncbi:MAG: hypothetical protein ETSY2_40625 [Candidatus Entotheonella gemina]|uniref:CHRD domain-containing protein n=1 Tax=Candidatus Entotheonella gemina TaxID=1429439 RepID=W4LNA9_9BACT|nr:MAG: hypothetical protein ETSY2_40625 [Candidatus Entotheonella gemina]